MALFQPTSSQGGRHRVIAPSRQRIGPRDPEITRSSPVIHPDLHSQVGNVIHPNLHSQVGNVESRQEKARAGEARADRVRPTEA